MEFTLKNRVAVVTGASKGIGKAIALSLAQEGCRVCIVSRTDSALEAARQEIQQQSHAEVVAIAGDVSDPALVDAILAKTADSWGAGIDILVNNAGGPPQGSFLEHDDAAWYRALNQNFISGVRLSRAVAPGMKERRWGRIICVTSTLAKEPSSQMVLSASARAAVSAFNKAIAAELAPFNITVNTVCPGGVQTDRVEDLMRLAAEKEGKSIDEVRSRSVASIPMQRFASTAEFANVVVFLASERASYLTGVSLMIDGGLTKSIF